MLHLIPKPWKAEEGTAPVSLTVHTRPEGDFEGLFPRLLPMLADREGPENRLHFEKDPALPAEGYAIACREGDIFVRASEYRGAFYAVMSLLQLAAGTGTFREVSIEDRPRYGYRGFMLDCARHFWTIPQIRRVIDLMGFFKLNVLHLHLTDDQGWRMEIKKYPRLTEVGSIRPDSRFSEKYAENREYGRGMFYTQEEMKALVAYAGDRGVQILPEIEMPGHTIAALTAYPEFACQGQNPAEYLWKNDCVAACMGNEDYFTFVTDIIDELCEIFPFPFFHIGGDEVTTRGWQKCPRCLAKIQALGLPDASALQTEFNHRLAAFLATRGRRMMGWNEILRMDETDLREDTVVEPWIEQPDFEREKRWIASGHSAVLASIHEVYLNMGYEVIPLKDTYYTGPESMGVPDVPNVLGMEAPMWTEFIWDEAGFAFYTHVRLAALAEACWTPGDRKNYEEFEARVEQMRPWLEREGMTIPEPKIYTGNLIDRDKYEWDTIWKMLGTDPRYEFNAVYGQK